MSKRRKEPNYLWDRSGPVDAEVAEIEQLLAPLRYDQPMPAVDPPLARPRPSQLWWLAIAAGVALIIWGWLGREGAELAPPVARMPIPSVDPSLPPPAPQSPDQAQSPDQPQPAARPDPRAGDAWDVEVVSGAPVLDGSELAKAGKLPVGAWIETDASSRARVSIADIGTLDVEPGSRVRLLGTSQREHRIELRQGSVHAFVAAPPRVFLVETPKVTFVDLGCEYQLEVAADGGTVLRVNTGWVALETTQVASYVPAGAMCRAASDGTPGLPVRRAAPAAYIAAVHRFETGDASAATELVAQAHSGDEVTLWHLLARVEESQRRAVYDKLAKLGGPAEDPAAVLRADKEALERWGRALSVVPPLSWTEGPPDPAPPEWNPDDMPKRRLQAEPAPERWAPDQWGPAPGPSQWAPKDVPKWVPPDPQPPAQPDPAPVNPGSRNGAGNGQGNGKGTKGSKTRKPPEPEPIPRGKS